MLQINILEKKYAEQSILKSLCLEINQVGIYGLIGKNGHGKTTLFRCILGLEKFEGISLLEGEKTTLQNIAWCPAEPPIYDELTAEEFYDFYANLLDVKVLDNQLIFELPKDKLIKDFSTGMKKKVFINAVFQREYLVYFLDEPFNGLDLESNYILMEYLKELAKKCIVIISSHIIDVLYQNCDKIFVINKKTLLEFDSENFHQIQNTLFEKKES